MKYELYSHCNAEQTIDSEVKRDVLEVISKTKYTIHEGCANELRNTILSQLKTVGWSDDFKLDVTSQITLTSSIKDHVLCFQTGNMGRFYADLLKLQFVFKRKKIKAAIYLIPSKHASKEMGSNIAHFDRFVKELDLFKEIITVPTLVIGLN
jgi:hypothetical protein